MDILEQTDTTLEECQELCMVNQPNCRSIDYLPNYQTCYHNSLGWGDIKAYTLDANAAVVYYMFCDLGETIMWKILNTLTHPNVSYATNETNMSLIWVEIMYQIL